MHLTCSSVIGAGFGCFAYLQGFSIPLSVYGGVLCSYGGIIPDIDSKTSTSFRQCLAMFAGFSALLVVSRLSDFSLNTESVIVIGSSVFLLIWTVIGTLIKKLTRHRGMFHSIPMALIVAEAIFIISSGDLNERLFKAFSIFLGVMIHLVLDEIYSVEGSKNGTLYFKKSFGTALKMLDFENISSTVFIYLVLAVMTQVAIHAPSVTEKYEDPQAGEDGKARRVIELVQKKSPQQFDIAVVEWAATNKIILEPDSKSNPKWRELQSLFEGNGSAKNSTDESPVVKETGNPNSQTVKKKSFLETINDSLRKQAQKYKNSTSQSTQNAGQTENSPQTP